MLLNTLNWIVYYYDCNADKITTYNILKNYKDDIMALKKKSDNFNEFSESLRNEMMYRYWSKAEYEIVIKKDSKGHIFLEPWCGCRDVDKTRVEIINNIETPCTLETVFDWSKFYEFCAKEKRADKDGCIKIDIYDQLLFLWKDFAETLWKYHFKYERKSEKYKSIS